MSKIIKRNSVQLDLDELTDAIRNYLTQIETIRNQVLKTQKFTAKQKRIYSTSLNNILAEGLILYDQLLTDGSSNG